VVELRLAAWGLLVAGVALIGIAFILDYRKVSQAVGGRRGRFSLGSGIMASIFVGITILINAISIGQYHRFDTSSLSQFTLTPQTIAVLEQIESPLKATGFFVPDDYYGIGDYLESLLTEYENSSPQISVQYIDPDEHLDKAKAYGITEYQTVVFESEGRRRLVEPSEYLELDTSGNVTQVNTEYSFTSAILEVTGVAQKKVYFLTGHGEASVDGSYSKVKEGLMEDLYLIGELNLITDPVIPDDCDVLIIAAPENTLSENEIKVLYDYLDNGGQMMILANPGERPDLNVIMAVWGVYLGGGTIIDPGSSVSPYTDMPLVPSSRNYFLLTNVYFPGATAIIPLEGIEEYSDYISMTPLVYTSSSSWLDMNYTADEEPVFDSDSETMESLAIGVMIYAVPMGVEADKYTRLIVMGDSDFANDEHYENGNNSDLFLNSVGWLAEGTELISIRRNVQPFRRLVVTEAETMFIEYSSIALVPLLVLAAGGIIWWRRR
jgi:ABC-type uncharacterized transport system involved in gliding motility auxiliary subunit